MQDKEERKMFDEKEIAYLQEMEERITRSMAVLIESDGVAIARARMRSDIFGKSLLPVQVNHYYLYW